MTLIIVGTAERTLPLAAVAAVSSAERVLFTGGAETGELTVPVEGNGFSGTAAIASIAMDAHLDGDSFVAVGTAEELEGIFSASAEAFAGKPVLLAPGGFGGALVFADRFRQWGLPEPQFSEVSGWIVGGRLQDGRVRIGLRRKNFALAAASNEETAAALSCFTRFFPDLIASDLISTSLANINAIIHPPLALLNATRIDNGELWHYWDEGFTPAVTRLMEAVDHERLNLVKKLQGTPASLAAMALTSGGDDGLSSVSFYQEVRSFEMYRNRPGPTELDNRFLTEDVPHGIAGYEQLAVRLGTEHSALTAVRVLAEVILGRQLKANPYAVEALVAYARQRNAAVQISADEIVEGAAGARPGSSGQPSIGVGRSH